MHQVIEAVDLVKTYNGRAVVNQVSMNLKRGEIVGLLGPNGAGKTTIFYMIVGLIRPDSGQIRLDGEVINKLPMYLRARSGIGYLPQEASVFRKLTVEQNILAVLETMNMEKTERRIKAENLMEELNIAGVRKTKGFALSGGERRRVEICRALAASPSFLLLDEPFAGIDPIVVNEIQSIINRLKKRGIGILITDHNVRETLEITDRAYIINEGSVLESGLPSEIVQSERARRIYLGDKFTLAT
ncbi:MAG: LPS export ABC transporter ATP-binding protein [bacterium]|nr:LPS export ABC transporter ATP-binding protein [bacterium]